MVTFPEIQRHTSALFAAHAITPEQQELLDAALADLHQKPGGASARTPLCVELPLLIHHGITGDDAPALPIAVAALLLYAGVELLDDAMDGDLGPAWAGRRASEVMLAGTTLIATLPHLALLEASASPQTVTVLQGTLARGLLAMSAGQQGDLALTDSNDAPVETVDAVAQGKAGALPAMVAAMAARLAGASEDVIGRYEALGQALGTARQFRSDCHDLFGAQDSRDLVHGTRTMPIALYLQGLKGEKRSAFLTLLDAARRDAGMRAAVRRRLLDAGTLRECAVLIELYCAEARDALFAAAPTEPAATRLRMLIDEVSFVAGEGETGANDSSPGAVSAAATFSQP